MCIIFINLYLNFDNNLLRYSGYLNKILLHLNNKYKFIFNNKAKKIKLISFKPSITLLHSTTHQLNILCSRNSS